MKIKDLKALTKEELVDKLVDFKKQLMDLQYKRKTGVEKPHTFKVIKKDIARIHTILNEGENNSNGE